MNPIRSINSTEIELLLSCARTRLEHETVEHINSLVQKDIDWEYLIQLSIRQRVMPLLYQALKKTCPQAVPGGILKQLRSYYLSNVTRCLFLSGRLLKILNRFEGHGILAVPFKGPVLAESVYGDLALRQFGDLDILVHKYDALKARNLLLSDGYHPELRLRASQDRAYLRTEYYYTVISDNGRVIVELHWEMTGRNSFFPFDLESVKERLKMSTLAGKNVHDLCPEDLLVYLCIHGAKHCWGILDWICSVAELVRSRPAMDWIQVSHIAGRMRCERVLYLGLFLTHDLLAATLPGQVLKRIDADARIRRLAEDVYENLFSKTGEFFTNGINPRFSMFHMKVRDRLSEKIRCALHLAFSPTVEEWRILPLPACISFLHYVFRPIRLAVGLIHRSYRFHRTG